MRAILILRRKIHKMNDVGLAYKHKCYTHQLKFAIKHHHPIFEILDCFSYVVEMRVELARRNTLDRTCLVVDNRHQVLKYQAPNNYNT